VVRFGTHRSGTPRLWCQVCRKRFTPVPKARRVTPEQEERIAVLLRERLSQRAVARALKVSRDTIRRTLNKRPHPSGCVSTSSHRSRATRWRSMSWWCATAVSGTTGTSGLPSRD
jgi:DNA invertase Pin-like site-specific DNA recombinase